MCAGGREQSEVELGSGECAMQSGKLICFVALGALLGATVGWSSNASCDVVRGALSALLHLMAHLFNAMFFRALFQPAALLCALNLNAFANMHPSSDSWKPGGGAGQIEDRQVFSIAPQVFIIGRGAIIRICLRNCVP